jgi:hypothetical protein
VHVVLVSSVKVTGGRLFLISSSLRPHPYIAKSLCFLLSSSHKQASCRGNWSCPAPKPSRRNDRVSDTGKPNLKIRLAVSWQGCPGSNCTGHPRLWDLPNLRSTEYGVAICQKGKGVKLCWLVVGSSFLEWLAHAVRLLWLHSSFNWLSCKAVSAASQKPKAKSR